MNSNLKYVYLIMYDIPSNDVESVKDYTKFRKGLLKLGGVMLQESVYFIHLNSKDNILNVKNELKLISPKVSNVRGLVITNAMFDNIDVIHGDLSVGEMLVNSKINIIEL